MINFPLTPLPSTRQIQFFLALQQEGSFHKAAKSCGVTQSTISAAIREMETVLGVTLVDRSNRKKLVFTPQGQDMLRTGHDVITQMEALAERARRSTKLLSTPLRIGIIPTIAPYLLPRILRPLQQKFPALTLHLHEIQTDDLLTGLENGTLDYGLMAFPYHTATNMQIFPIQGEDFLCAAPREIFANKKSVTTNDIEQHKILLLADGHCLRHHALSSCSLKTVTHHQNNKDDVSATSLSTLVQLVAEGYGVTLLPKMVIDHTTLPDTVKILPIIDTPTREIGGIWRKKSPVEQDAMALSLAIYRLINGADIYDDHINPDLTQFRHIGA